MFFGDILLTFLGYVATSNHVVDAGFWLDAAKLFFFNGMVSIYNLVMLVTEWYLIWFHSTLL